MKKLLLLPLFLVLLGIGVIFWFSLNTKPVSSGENFNDFLIIKGSSAGQIGNKLQKEGFIKSALAFKVYIQFSGKSARIQAGEYRLSPHFSLFDVVKELLSGPKELWVTIPEGLRREEIALRFANGLSKDQEFVEEFLALSNSSEGRLFPDTYLFPKAASASAIVNRMLKTFDAKVDSLELNSGLTQNETLVLASLLERETKTDEERPMVAGILLNRIQAGWPLQVDAAVQYAIGTTKCEAGSKCSWWETLTKSDLAINSPFNTYKFPGLPPSPIANPGISSIEAAFNPTQNEYWYYIHDSKGQIHYAETLEEHNANIAKYLSN